MLQTRHPSLPAVIFYGVLFLFAFQLFADFMTTLSGLVIRNQGLTFAIIALLLLFSPLLLYFIREAYVSTLIFVLGKLVLFMAIVEVLLDTGGKLTFAGLGVASFLLFFPLLLWDRARMRDRLSVLEIGVGLVLGLALSIFLRNLGGGMNIAVWGAFQVLGWTLAAIGGAAWIVIFVQSIYVTERPKPNPQLQRNPLRLMGVALGITAAILLLFSAFTFPQGLPSWMSENYLIILSLLAVVLSLFVWLLTMRREFLTHLSPTIVLIWNALFVIALALAVYFNLDQAANGAMAYAPLLLAILFFPIVIVDMLLLVDRIVVMQPTLKELWPSFSVASFLMLLIVILIVAIRSEGHFPFLGPLVQDKFWLVQLLSGLVLALSMFLARDGVNDLKAVQLPDQYARIVTGTVVAFSITATIAGILVAL